MSDAGKGFFFAQVLAADLLSKEQVSVDGTTLEALAPPKSCRPSVDTAGGSVDKSQA